MSTSTHTELHNSGKGQGKGKKSPPPPVLVEGKSKKGPSRKVPVGFPSRPSAASNAESDLTKITLKPTQTRVRKQDGTVVVELRSEAGFASIGEDEPKVLDDSRRQAAMELCTGTIASTPDPTAEDLAGATANFQTEQDLAHGGYRRYYALFMANQMLVQEGIAKPAKTQLVTFVDGGSESVGSTAHAVAELIRQQARDESGKITLSESWTDEALRYLRRVRHPGQAEKIVALNYANCTCIGGNYSDGGMVKAQEEELCRQFPALFESLKTCEEAGAKYEAHLWRYSQHVFGAMFGDGYSKARNVLFTQEVACLRNSPQFDYRLLDSAENRVLSGFVEAAAPLFNRGRDDDFSDWQDHPEEWYEKLFLNVFYAPKSVDPTYDIIVVGPFGCGAFGNDPKVVAESFLKTITKHNILKLYKEVHFCLGRSLKIDTTAGGACNRNVVEFREVLQEYADDYTADLQAKATEWMEADASSKD